MTEENYIHDALYGFDYSTLEAYAMKEKPWDPRIVELKAEVERLRTALIAVTKVEPEYSHDWGMQCIKIAQSALNSSF